MHCEVCNYSSILQNKMCSTSWIWNKCLIWSIHRKYICNTVYFFLDCHYYMYNVSVVRKNSVHNSYPWLLLVWYASFSVRKTEYLYTMKHITIHVYCKLHVIYIYKYNQHRTCDTWEKQGLKISVYSLVYYKNVIISC